MNVGERIKALLDERSWSINKLSINAGVPYTTLYAIIQRGSGKRIQPDTLQKIADALGTSTAYLLGKTDDPSAPIDTSLPQAPTDELQSAILLASKIKNAFLDETEAEKVSQLIRTPERIKHPESLPVDVAALLTDREVRKAIDLGLLALHIKTIFKSFFQHNLSVDYSIKLAELLATAMSKDDGILNVEKFLKLYVGAPEILRTAAMAVLRAGEWKITETDFPVGDQQRDPGGEEKPED